MPTDYAKGRDRLVAVVAALATAAGAVLLWLGLQGLAEDPDLALGAPVQETTVAAGPDGFSLWSTDADAYGSAVCTASGERLLRPVSGYGVEVDGTTYHELARSPEGLSGEVTVTCEPAQEFRVGPHAGATSTAGLRGTTGVLVGTALLVLGLALGSLALVSRVRRRRLESFRVPARRLETGLPPREPSPRREPGLSAYADPEPEPSPDPYADAEPSPDPEPEPSTDAEPEPWTAPEPPDESEGRRDPR